MKPSDFAFVEPHERFERGWNRLQQSIEVGVAVIVAAGLVGVFGSGPISSVSGRFPGVPVTMTYERLMRRTVQSKVVFAIHGPVGRAATGVSETNAADGGSIVDVTLPNAFTHHFEVVSTSPRSVLMRADAAGVTYVFALGPAHEGEIVFSVKPQSSGLGDASVAVAGHGEALRQFVFP